ncbi:MAG: sulfite exporter TauE/SafE family protein [Ilumatobacteraceae bacterium]
MTVPEAAALTAAVFIASFVQVNVGFGFALLAVPLMTIGLRTQDAVVVSTLLGLLTSGAQAWQGRRFADWILVRRLTAASLFGIPIGLVVFKQLDPNVLKGVLGIGVLVATYLLIREVNLAHRGPGLEWAAGLMSGALASSLSTNGPPLVFALQGRRLPIDAFRSTISLVFVTSGVLAMVAFIVTDEVRSQAITGMFFAIPALALGVGAGFKVRPHLDEEMARRAVLGLLAAVGVMSIVGALASS